MSVRNNNQSSVQAIHLEEDARRFLEVSFDGIWAIDSELRTSFVNARMAEMLGYSREEMLGRSLYDFLFPDEITAEQEAIQRRRSGIREEFELRYRRKDGSELWARVATAPVLAEDGTFQAAVAIHSDITRRRQIEQELQAREAELREAERRVEIERGLAEQESRKLAAIVESSYDAIISKNLSGIITSWNPAATQMFGYLPEEVIGRSILVLIPPELHREEDLILARLRAGERIHHYETERLTKTGQRLQVSITISPIRDTAGRVIGASKIARDVSDRKRAEQALLTGEKLAATGRLAATVAHEINNPLESVTNLVYLANRAGTIAEVQAYLGMAEEELARIAQLTRQTLGFYRQRSKRTRLHVGSELRQLVAVFSSRAQNKGLSINIETADDAEIVVDRTEFRQLFANLISNSIDACESGGAIRLRTSGSTRASDSAHGLRVTIADNGSGIGPADRPSVFEPFFTTKQDTGTGLGLWVCKQIAEKYGWSIHLRSNATPGRSWTAVSIFLPAKVFEGSFQQVA